MKSLMDQERSTKSVKEALDRVRTRASRSGVDLVDLLHGLEDLYKLAKSCPATPESEVERYYGCLEAVRRWEGSVEFGPKLGELVLSLIGSPTQKAVVLATQKWQKQLKKVKGQENLPSPAASMPATPMQPQQTMLPPPMWVQPPQLPSGFGHYQAPPHPHAYSPYHYPPFRGGPRGRRGAGQRASNPICYNCRATGHKADTCPEPKRA